MLKTAIICPDQQLCEHLRERLVKTGRVQVSRVLTQYPDPLELKQSLRGDTPDVIFLSGESLREAVDTVQTILSAFPEVQIVAVLRDHHPSDLLRMMRAGVRDCLSLPFELAEVEVVLARAASQAKNTQKSEVASNGDIIAFLPSKPGDGASTVVLNTALAVAAGRNGTLLADLDVSSGMLRFMLKLANENSIADASERADSMDTSLWKRLVDKVANLDVIHSGPCNPAVSPSAGQVRRLAEFWRQQYSTIFVDLSGEMNEHTLEVLHESRQVFLVCTAETSSLHQAQEKLHYFKTLGMADRVKLIVNRDAKHVIVSLEKITELLGVPVHAVISNDYARVQQALQHGRGVEKSSVLGKQFASLAASITGVPQAVASETVARRLLGWLTSKRVRAVVAPQTAELA